MSEFRVVIAKVREVENINSSYIDDGLHELDKPFDGLRIRAEIEGRDYPKNNETKYIPWAFPLLPKTFQSIPKVGESVFLIYDAKSNGQRYYIGPIISQPQFNTHCEPKNAKSLLLEPIHNKPLEKVSNNNDTKGAYPKSSDIAVIGRGAEDLLLRYDKTTKESEVQIRAGVRGEPINDSNPNMIGNIIFNGTDPAYIQLKYKNGLTKKNGQQGNSIINMVANRINIMSNKDDNISHNLGNNQSMILDEKMDEIMDNLHQVPMGDKLVELLKIMKGCIMHHVHPWAGMATCGDWGGYVEEMKKFDLDTVLSKCVRIS